MAIEDFHIPELGENIRTATVVEVLVQAGTQVTADQALLSLETDKAEFEVPCPHSGTVTEVLVREGDEVTVGQAVVRIEAKTSSETAANADAAPVAAPEPAPEPAPVAAPAPPPVRSEEPAEQLPPTAAATAAPGQEAVISTPMPPPTGAGPVPAPPSVRRMARELGVEIRAVEGSGPAGRISERDVQRYARSLLTATPAVQTTAAANIQPNDDHAADSGPRDAWGPIQRQPLNKVRQRIAAQMTQAWSEIPQVTHHDLADITELERLRSHYAVRVERNGSKLTLTAILLNVVAAALKKFPLFNATLDMASQETIFKGYVNVAVAVDTERGLLAPVIRNIDQLNIGQIAAALDDLSRRARGKALTPDLLQGATFTLSNLGGIGGTAFSPIINPPEVAILGVARGRTEAVWNGQAFEPKQLLPLALTYDHRLIDGADAARFLRWICEAMEEPFLLELEGG